MSASVPTLIEELWPGVTLPTEDTVLHVVATWPVPRDDGARRVIKIAEHGPKSATDFFLLNLARARADAILTTGKILREEPTLRYDLQGEHAEALHRWRKETLGKLDAPRVLILTSGRDLDLDHPSFSSWAKPVIVTSDEGAQRVREDATARQIGVVALSESGPRAAVGWARQHGARTVSIEAGPSTARAFYAKPAEVDELWLSEFLEPDLTHDLRGAAAPDNGSLRDMFGRANALATRCEASGRWRFTRYVRSRPS